MPQKHPKRPLPKYAFNEPKNAFFALFLFLKIVKSVYKKKIKKFFYFFQFLPSKLPCFSFLKYNNIKKRLPLTFKRIFNLSMP